MVAPLSFCLGPAALGTLVNTFAFVALHELTFRGVTSAPPMPTQPLLELVRWQWPCIAPP